MYLEILTIKNDVWYRFLVAIFYEVKELPFYSWFAEMIYHKRVLNFLNTFFSSSGELIVHFPPFK